MENDNSQSRCFWSPVWYEVLIALHWINYTIILWCKTANVFNLDFKFCILIILMYSFTILLQCDNAGWGIFSI